MLKIAALNFNIIQNIFDSGISYHMYFLFSSYYYN